MATHPDPLFKQTIFDIIKYGAKIGYTGPDQFIIGENLSSAMEAPEIITKDLENQIAKDRVTKLDILPSKFISSPLGLVPKSKGGWRRSIIYHTLKDALSTITYLKNGARLNIHLWMKPYEGLGDWVAAVR